MLSGGDSAASTNMYMYMLLLLLLNWLNLHCYAADVADFSYCCRFIVVLFFDCHTLPHAHTQTMHTYLDTCNVFYFLLAFPFCGNATVISHMYVCIPLPLHSLHTLVWRGAACLWWRSAPLARLFGIPFVRVQ